MTSGENKFLFFFTIGVCLISINVNANKLAGDFAGRSELFKKLFESYDENIVPDNVTVTLGVSMQYLDVNVEKSELESQAHLTQSWYDSRLAWDNASTGISIMHISPKKKFGSPTLFCPTVLTMRKCKIVTKWIEQLYSLLDMLFGLFLVNFEAVAISRPMMVKKFVVNKNVK